MKDEMKNEIYEGLALAVGQRASESLAGNIVKEEYWKGEAVAYQRILAVYENTRPAESADLKEALGVLDDMASIAEQDEWDKALTGRQLILKEAQEILNRFKEV